MGLSISKLLASRRAILALADMNEDGLVKAIESLRGDVSETRKNQQPHIYIRVDVRDSTSVNRWIGCTVEQLGRLDGAVNFAGVAKKANVIDETDESWAVQMDVNAKGIVFCIRVQLKHTEKGEGIVSHESVEYCFLDNSGRIIGARAVTSLFNLSLTECESHCRSLQQA